MIWGSDLFRPGSFCTYSAAPENNLHWRWMLANRHWSPISKQSIICAGLHEVNLILSKTLELKTFWANSWSWAQNSLNSCFECINLSNHTLLRWYNTNDKGQRDHKVSCYYNDLQWNLSHQGKSNTCHCHLPRDNHNRHFLLSPPYDSLTDECLRMDQHSFALPAFKTDWQSTMWLRHNDLITVDATDEVWHTLEEKKRWLKCFDFLLNPPVAAARWRSWKGAFVGWDSTLIMSLLTRG